LVVIHLTTPGLESTHFKSSMDILFFCENDVIESFDKMVFMFHAISNLVLPLVVG